MKFVRQGKRYSSDKTKRRSFAFEWVFLFFVYSFMSGFSRYPPASAACRSNVSSKRASNRMRASLRFWFFLSFLRFVFFFCVCHFVPQRIPLGSQKLITQQMIETTSKRSFHTIIRSAFDHLDDFYWKFRSGTIVVQSAIRKLLQKTKIPKNVGLLN